MMNSMFRIDFYKADHRRQYPDGTQRVYSNWTPRKTRRSYTDSIVFFGLQYFILEYLIDDFNKNFFRRSKSAVLKEYKRLMDACLGPDAIPVDHIAALHDLGYLPLEIKALPEGTLVPMRVPAVTVVNTKDEFFWLVNYMETLMSCVLWKPCTSATTAFQYLKTFYEYAKRTGAPLPFVPWQGHDFSMRGMGGPEDAILSGMAHLAVGFTGTDTVPAIVALEKYYYANMEREFIGGSVPATEHSVMCAGEKDGEFATFQRLMRLYPAGILSVVSDTWDFWQVITEFLPRLKDQIMARKGKLVIRPDSGDPVRIICGARYKEVEKLTWDGSGRAYILGDYEYVKYDGKYYRVVGPSTHSEFEEFTPTAEQKGAIECMWEVFGGTTTSQGYRLLDEHIGLIYGDSITVERQQAILEQLAEKGFASGNVVLGIGSYTYVYVTRDTDGWAMKATAVVVNGELRPIFKSPKTDDGTKISAKGLIQVTMGPDGRLIMKDECTWAEEKQGLLIPVFRDGVLLRKQTLGEIRERVKAYLPV
jgi:nicotinamide phosphoribosyltransferase